MLHTYLHSPGRTFLFISISETYCRIQLGRRRFLFRFPRPRFTQSSRERNLLWSISCGVRCPIALIALIHRNTK
ncbi:hypothetical protein PMAYCL1PPCAC_12780, partial [Pristionchus mayeri]